MLSKSLFDRWYNENKETQGLLIAVGVFPDEDVAPENLARNWFNKRISEVNREIATNVCDDGIIIFRCMKVDQKWIQDTIDGKTEHLGSHWTIDGDLVKFLQNGTGGKLDLENVILEAKVSVDEFDPLSLLNPSYSEDFEEYEILPIDKVSLLRIWNGDKSKLLHEFSEPKSFKVD